MYSPPFISQKAPNHPASFVMLYVLFSAEVMSNFIKTNVASGADGHYTDSNIDSNLLTQDILIYGDPVHVGICTAEDTSMGSFICGDVWILYRETWNPMQ